MRDLLGESTPNLPIGGSSCSLLIAVDGGIDNLSQLLLYNAGRLIKEQIDA
jgi:hypothetical protein